MAPLVRTGGSRHTGLAALPHRNIHQVFADLLPHLIRVIENVGMLIIDEFGNSIHNKLAEKIIEFFMENVALR